MKKQEKKVFHGILRILLAAVLLGAALRVTVQKMTLASAGICKVFDRFWEQETAAELSLTAAYKGVNGKPATILQKYARKIGLQVAPTETHETAYEGRKELVWVYEASGTQTVLQFGKTDEGEQYLKARVLAENTKAQAAKRLLEQMREAAKRMSFTDISTVAEYSALVPGEMGLLEKDQTTEALLSKLCASVVYEHRENKDYVVYAYTVAEEEYLTVGGYRVNVMIAISYDREKDATRVVLATPIGL